MMFPNKESMNRYSQLIDCTLVTLSAATILLSLLPFALSQQSPGEQFGPAAPAASTALHVKQAQHSDPKTAQPPVDPAIAVARWQQEAAEFYAARDADELNASQSRSLAHSETQASLPKSQSSVQRADLHQPVVLANSDAAKGFLAPVSSQTSNAVSQKPFRFITPSRAMPLTFLLAICGGLAAGLAFLVWSRVSPEQLFHAMVFHCDENAEVTMQNESCWTSVSQSGSVKLRRAVLCGLVVTALATLVV